MITRDKSGIFKPRVFNIEVTVVPSTLKETLQNHNWVAPMKEKYDALRANHTRTLPSPYRHLVFNPLVVNGCSNISTTLMAPSNITKSSLSQKDFINMLALITYKRSALWSSRQPSVSF